MFLITKFLPLQVEEYKMYYAQSLYKACLYEEAMRVSCQIDNPEYQGKVLKLQVSFLVKL